MKVVITGAKGFLGSRVARAALAEGWEVIGVDLPGARSAPPMEGTGSYAEQDFDVLDPPEPFPEAIGEADAVIHCAGLIAGKPEDIRRVNVEGTRRLVEALCDQDGLRFVFLSSMAVVEAHPGAYGRSKKEAEDLVKKRMPSWTVIRPSMIYGPSDPGWTARLKERASIKRIHILPGGGRSLIQPVYVEDAAQAILKACVSEEALGRTFDLGGPEAIEQVAFLGKVRERLKGKTCFLSLPLWLFKILGSIAGSRYAAVAAFAGADHLVDIEPAQKLLGFKPRPISEGLALTFPGN
jgi:NADH dehydrogenase